MHTIYSYSYIRYLQQSRESRYAAVRAILEDNIKLRDKAEERFQTYFEREVHQLHNDVRTASEVREREDDEIVEALNRYTMKLQNSLKIINSTETQDKYGLQ